MEVEEYYVFCQKNTNLPCKPSYLVFQVTLVHFWCIEHSELILGILVQTQHLELLKPAKYFMSNTGSILFQKKAISTKQFLTLMI